MVGRFLWEGGRAIVSLSASVSFLVCLRPLLHLHASPPPFLEGRFGSCGLADLKLRMVVTTAVKACSIPYPRCALVRRGMREQLLVLYIAGLLEAEHFSLVPQYLPLTQPTNRRLLAHELLQLLTQQLNDAAGASGGNADAQGPSGSDDSAWSQADARCAKVYCLMAAWLQACLIRQQVQMQAEEDGAVGAGVGAAGDMALLSNALTTAVG